MSNPRSLAVGAFLSLPFVCLAQQPKQEKPRVLVANLPIHFEPFLSADQSNKMIARAPGGDVVFKVSELGVYLPDGSENLEITFPGSQKSNPVGVDLLTSQTNYLLGNDPSHWVTHVSNYRKVKYASLYPGVDTVFYGKGRQMEHDFIVSPGADYRQIRIHFGNHRAELSPDGGISVALATGGVGFERPIVYQQINGVQIPRKASFRSFENGDIGFEVQEYDRTLPLTIDPVLNFATYLSPNAPAALAIGTDSAGNSYVAGYASLGYPVTANAFNGCSSCTTGAVVTFISKLSPDGASLLYSTVLGGSSFAQPTGLAVDSKGDAIVTGFTGASDFPTKNGQPVLLNNAYFGFLASLSPDGSSLNFGTLLGTAPTATQGTFTYAQAVVVDPAGNAYVTGETGDGFPVTPGALNQGGGGNLGSQFNVYVAKFSPAGTLLYSAVIGDADPQNGGGGPIGSYALAVDSGGNAYVAGQAGTLWPVSSNAYLKQVQGSLPYANPFVTKVAADAKSLVYSTFLDYAYLVTGIAPLANGNVWVSGTSVGPNHPTTANAYQKGSPAGGEAFLTQLDSTGSSLVYATSLGDSTYTLQGFALDPADQSIWIASRTTNQNFPLVTPLQSTFPSSGIGPYGPVSVVNHLDATGENLLFSTFLGGAAPGYASSVAVDTQHRAHVGGAAQYGMYTTPGVYAPAVPVPGQGYTLSTYAYAALIDPNVSSPALCVSPNAGFSFPVVPVGTSQDVTLTITSCGTEALTVTGASTGAAVFTVPAASNQCNQSLPVGQSCTMAVRYTPTSASTDSSALTIASNASIPVAVLPISGTGTVPKISVLSRPSFPDTLIGQTSAPQTILIQSVGQAPLVIDASKTVVSGDFSLRGIGSCGTPFSSGACTFTVYFTPTAPGTRLGTLTIASNDPVNPTVSVPLMATGFGGAPVPEVMAASSQLVQAGADESNFVVLGYGFMPDSVVQLNGIAQPTTYVSNTFLSVNLPASSIPAGYGELTLTVATPAPGGGTSAPFTLTEFQALPQITSSLVYEPHSKMLYASIPAIDTSYPNTIAVIDPVTVTVKSHIAVGNNPGVLATSQDGSYLYVGLNGDHAIQRINLSNYAIERTFSLPVDATFGMTTVFDMHVAPAVSTEVVASLQIQASPSEDGIAMFNDTGLINWIPGQPQPQNQATLRLDRFTFTNSSFTLYARPSTSSGISEITYGTAGLQFSGSTCCVPVPPALAGQHLATDGTLIYTDTGLAWDPASGTLAKTFAVKASSVPDTVIPDGASSGKTYFLNPYGSYFQYQGTTIQAFDNASAALTGSLTFTSNTSIPNATGTQLVRWGTNGFAYRAATNVPSPTNDIFLFTSSIATAANLNPTPVANSLLPTATSATGSDFTLTVIGAGFVNGSTVEWNGSTRSTTVVSPTQLTATIYASDIAATGTAQIVVVSPGPGGGTSASLTFSIDPAVPAPVVTLSPNSLAFGAQTVGTTSAAQTVTLKNTGSANLAGLAFAISGTNAGSFAETTTCGATLASNASCGITLTFTPLAAGNLSAALAVTDNASGSPQMVTLVGSATAVPAPVVNLSPNALTFGAQAVGTTSAAEIVTLTNTGNATLSSLALAIAGINASSFAQTNTCADTLATNASCTLSVTFNPAVAGSFSATLTVSDNASGSPQAVTLSGSSPQEPLSIGPQSGGSTSSTVTAGQAGTYQLALTPTAGYTGTLSFSCNSLPANASCSFNPASLSLSSGNSGSVSVTIATEAQASAFNSVGRLPVIFAALILLPFTRRIRRIDMRVGAMLAISIVSALCVAACGGGASGSGSGNPTTTKVAPGTYSVQVVASDGTIKVSQTLTLTVK